MRSDDGEFEVEGKLRQAVAGRRPNAPAGLREFIRQVPTAYEPRPEPRRLSLGRPAGGVGGRRGFTGIAAAAAVIVLAVAGGTALLAIRHGQTQPTAAARSTAPFDLVTADWGWRRVGEPAPGLVAQLDNGYLGECISRGLPAACTSKDGLTWTLPPDSAVLAVDGGAPFEGWSVAHGAAGWAATGTIDPGTWRSSDGIHWSAVALNLPGLQTAQVQALAGGFAMVAQIQDGQQKVSRLLLSTDGTTWTPQDLPAGISPPQLGGAIGLVAMEAATGGTAGGSVVASSDGLKWHTLTLPDGVSSVSASTRLASGTYVAAGNAGPAFGAMTLLTSPDGVNWQKGTGLSPWLNSLAVVGPHILAISNIPSTDLSALWESTDGSTWQRVTLLDGNPLSGTQVVALGDRVGLFSGSRLTMVGAPLPAGYPTGTPPSSSPSTAASPTATSGPALIVGGWRWHQLSVTPDFNQGTVVRVPNGYFGRCGAAMCTSPNGWSWQVPADPAIFDTDGPALFTPLSVAHRPDGGYVVNAGEGVWYSLDGLHWKPSPAPADAAGFRAVMHSASSFTLIGSPDDTIGGKSRVYTSPDGATWTAAGIGPMVGLLAQGDTSGGILDQTGKTPIGAAMGYTADGRTWVAATLPKNQYASNIAYRLGDGGLVILGGGAILHSTDGRSWAALKTGWAPDSMAISGDRIVAVAIGSGGKGTAWESTDNAATFHKLMDGAGHVSQFGDLVVLSTDGGAFVGAPLSAAEGPGTTPTATGLPGATPAPTPTTAPTPAGGISRDEALRIATNAVHPTAEQVARASVSAYLDSRYGRWIWSVSFIEQYGGPTGSSGRFVDIDFFTGAVLSSGQWIS